MKTLFTLFIATFFISQTTPEHRAWIDAQQTDDMLTVRGRFANDSQQDATFRYQLLTTKQGPSGSSTSTQAGSFTAPAGQEVSLSNTSINVTPADLYVIELKIFQADSVYLHDKIEHQG